jgi:23S rRNA (guanine2445-N2)-methyltransferase / 23S rRNA (guanine2069-N7)-methyltransferase
VSPAALRFLASAPRGLADLLLRELSACGAIDARERSAGVGFSGALECAYRACLWSRVANRVFLEVARFEARDAQEFLERVRGIDWALHLGPGATLACEFSGRHPAITHTHFGTLKLKDGIVDALRSTSGARPDVALDRPDVRVHAHARGTAITVSLDLSGESLHRRGYRGAAGEAPLKENVAAGVLLRSGWAELAASGAELLDPLCGSGTLCIEAALIAARRAPGLSREYFGFLGWRGHDAALWMRLRAEAAQLARDGLADAAGRVSVRGTDRDALAVARARDNARRAGIEALAVFDTAALAEAAPSAGRDPARQGLLCTNPPYGVRLQDLERARALHRELGQVLRERFRGWQAAVLTGSAALGVELGLRAHRTHALWNGGIECRLLRIRVQEASVREPGTLGRGLAHLADTPEALMFANRLAKNLRQRRRWAQRAGISCYRLYDADMPEYAFAIDLYETLDPPGQWLCVQEYAAPAEIEAQAARRRRGEVLASLPQATGVPRERIRVRAMRRRIRRGEQYQKVAAQGRFHLVAEGGLRFEVNFEDYLDTGLFLDQRITRGRLRDAAGGVRFLNLFGYTGTATVYAAAGGAAASTTVDLSGTYLAWAHRNLAHNGLATRAHELVRAECRSWLEQAAGGAARYDLVFLDPPTFSRSKRMQGVLDIERDHPQLIDACARLLAPGGLLIFSSNAQRFRLHQSLGERYAIRDISSVTLPADFARNPRIHRCYEVRVR